MNAIVQLVQNLETRSDKFAEYNEAAPSTLDFEQECLFARQALTGNNYLCGVAAENQQSLMDAIYNVASTGISLNPARSHAYLVPRSVGGQRKVCLDISYRGLLKLATDTGVTKYMKAELVYENDEYEYRGFDQRPKLVANPFKDRGNPIGVYAMAMLHDDSVLVENMTIEQVNGIRDDSEAYKSVAKYSDPKSKDHYKYERCVWVKYYEEMVKKTVLKRAFKTLPETKGKPILDMAVETINEHEGIDFDAPVTREIEYTLDQSDAYKTALEAGDYIGLLCVREKCSIEGLHQLYDAHEAPKIAKGNKGAYAKGFDELIATARDVRESNLALLIEACDIGDPVSVLESIGDDVSGYALDWYCSKLNAEQESFTRSALEQQEAA